MADKIDRFRGKLFSDDDKSGHYCAAAIVLFICFCALWHCAEEFIKVVGW